MPQRGSRRLSQNPRKIAAMSSNASHIEISEWCRTSLGSAADEVLFETGFASRVLGLRLADDRRVVAKIRAAAPRLVGGAIVQRHLWEAGFPCPEPLAGPTEFAGQVISAETLVLGGSALVDDPRAPELYASALADLVRLAPSPDAVPTLSPPPVWACWNPSAAGPWPDHGSGDFADVDLNTCPGPVWLDEVAIRVRNRLAGCSLPPVVGHADWWSGNLRWIERTLHVVHDWDSITVQPEAIFAGQAAYLFAASTFELDGSAPGASIEGTERFLAAYERVRGLPWTADELELAWAAGLWIAAFHAKQSTLADCGEGFAEMVRGEAPERLRRAAA
jgi:hypothetical protein